MDESLINEFEKAEQIVFERPALKRTIDSWLVEIDEPEAYGWTVQKNTDEFRLWTKKEGLTTAPHVPAIQFDYFFPDVEDPRVILATLLHYRHLIDNKTTSSITNLD